VSSRFSAPVTDWLANPAELGDTVGTVLTGAAGMSRNGRDHAILPLNILIGDVLIVPSSLLSQANAGNNIRHLAHMRNPLPGRLVNVGHPSRRVTISTCA